MLDLIITYINFIILSLKIIIKKILFQPPKPKTYKIIENSDKNKNNLEIYIKHPNHKNYRKIKKRVHLDVHFQKIPDKNNNNIPSFIFKPTLSLHKACIIYCHGNSCDIGSTFNECCDLAKLTKCVIVSFDYPGYGLYQNIESNEKNIYKTVQIIYEYVKEKLKLDENSIIVYGFSLGTGVAFDLACNKNYNFAGLILQSPFLSIFRTMYNTKITKYFDLFNSCDKVKFLNIKTLFIHGNKDRIVPYAHGRILSKLIPKSKFYNFQTINGAGHNDIFSAKNLIYLSEIIKDFIERCCNSGSYPDNKTVINKKINNINYNFEVNDDINSHDKIFNTSIEDKKKEKINEHEYENKSFSENNSAFLIRKKDSFLELLKEKKSPGCSLIKTNYIYKSLDEEKNGFDSMEKLVKSENKFYKGYLQNSLYDNKNINNQTNIIDKTEKNSNNKYNEIKTVNISESYLTQKEEFSDNDIKFNNLQKKPKNISLEKIMNISKVE